MSWLGSSKSSNTTSSSLSDGEKKLEQPVSLSVRFGLPDKRREAVRIAVAPNRTVSAVVDTFGRVLLVDLNHGVALRIWKGYRDAQVAWLEAEESGSGIMHRTARTVLFLVIYAPRRGILEVWAAEQGPRVAAFNVGKGGRLYGIEYKMLGLNAATHRNVVGQRHNQPLYSALFLDRSGHLSMLDVPFHLCLTDRSSHRAHDYHLLKQLRRIIRESNAASKDEVLLEAILNVIREFRLVGFLEQAVERILNTTYLSVPLLEQLFKDISSELENDQLCKMSPVSDKQRLILYGKTVLCLIDTFSAVQTISFHEEEEEEEEEKLGATAGQSSKSTAELLQPHLPAEWSQENLARLAKVLDYNSQVAGSRATSSKPEAVSVIQFLNWFYTQFKKEPGGLQREVLVHAEISLDNLVAMGAFFFRSNLIGYTTSEDLLAALQKSCIPRQALLRAFLAFYLSEERHAVSHVDWLAALLQQLLHFKAEESVASSPEVIGILEPLQVEIRACKKIGAPVLLTLAVISALRSEIRAREKVDHEGVEALCAVLPTWLQLLRRTEDATALQLLLAHRPVGEDPLLPAASPTQDRLSPLLTFSRSATTASMVTLDRPPSTDLSVSQVRLAEGGRGFVTELTARWATRWRLTLADLQCLYAMLGESSIQPAEAEAEAMEVEVEQGEGVTTEEIFSCLYDHFPMALEMDALLANVAWEYIFLWSKDQEEVTLFGAAIDCLQHLGPAGALVCHGVASMAWHMHIQKVVQCAAYLIEKVGGKAPKDRLCRKETNMSQGCLTQFLHHAFLFMETFKQANCDADVVPAFMMDQSWRSGVDGRLSLVELAIDQPLTNYGLLLHHSMLIFILDTIVRFDIRGFKPFSLFDQRGIAAFFKSMTSHPLLPGSNLDTPVVSQRTKFVSKLLEAVVSALAKGSVERHEFYRNTLVEQVAPHLGLDADETRRQHVAMLYAFGLDTTAEEYLPQIKDTTVLASQLLLIVGQRCAHLLFSSDGQLNLQRMALMPPVLEGYFKTSNYKELQEPNVPVASTQCMVSIVVQLMADDHPELHRARLISDTLERFANMPCDP